MARRGRELSDYLNMLEASSNGEDRVSDIGWISVRLIALGFTFVHHSKSYSRD